MFPEDVDFDEISAEIDTTINNIEMSDSGIFPYYDMINGDFIFDDKGRVKMAYGEDAITQWIYKILHTYIYRYDIYYDDEGFREYGTNVREIYLGEKLHYLLKLGMLEQEIEEALTTHRKIARVESFNLTSDKNILSMEFSVILADDEFTQIDIEEEVRIPRD